MKVLLVEDEPIPLMAMERYLGGRGFEVRAASTAVEAVSIAAEFQPDVLVADWLLEDGPSGLEAAQQIVGQRPQVRVVFVTGVPPHQVREQSRSLPWVLIVEKPCSLRELETRLCEIRDRDAGS